MRAVDADANAESAIGLVAIGLELGFIEYLLQDLLPDVVLFSGLGVEMSSALRLPAFLLGRLQFPAFLRAANELRGVEPLDRCLHFLDRGRLADFICQEGGYVGLGSRQIADELQQADDFGDPKRPTLVLRRRP